MPNTIEGLIILGLSKRSNPSDFAKFCSDILKERINGKLNSKDLDFVLKKIEDSYVSGQLELTLG